MTGAQAVCCAEIVRPHTAIPIHSNDLSVSHSGLDDFKRAAAESSAPVRFDYLAHGDRDKFTATR
ncbi:hypothetical protein [Streptomyces sp. NPDC005969]|uniref:hypothetical protein n=1 Tax=Streptomyces sp. NPDC005969 TaxID=3156722 RepID=UPI0033DACE71